MSDETGTGAAPAVSEDRPSAPTPAPERAAPEPDKQRQEVAREFFQRAMKRPSKASAPSSTADEKASSQPAAGPTEDPDEPITLTRAQLAEQVARAAQGEVDRRENKRQRDAEIKARKDQERWELDNDQPAIIERKRQELAQEETQTQQAQAAAAFTADLQTKYDRAMLDPIFLDLPESARASILKSNPFQGDTLKQREAITRDTLAALKKHYKAEGAAEAEAKLRRNPSIIKQQLVDLRDETEEPVTVAGSSSNGRGADMNTWIRRSLGRGVARA